jgi:hypothetical protein
MAFIALGAVTILSAFVFRELKEEDGENVSLRSGSAPTLH